MKKIIALLLAGVLCATAAYTAIAADDEEIGEEPVVVETEESQIDDLVAALEGDDQAQEIADNIADAVKNGAAKSDINELLVALADYINGKGYDVADVRTKKSKEIMGAFLEDCGVDSEALGAALSETGEVLDSIFGSEDAGNTDAGADTSVDAGSSSFDAGSSSESYAVYGVESTTIPDTGYIG